MPALAAAAGKRFAAVAVEPDGAGLQRLAEWVDAGRLTPHVSHELPLREAARAHELVAQGNTLGKIVLKVA
jgi:NADPH:quinone reductase-like Zn-dependent oxidoreductase